MQMRWIAGTVLAGLAVAMLASTAHAREKKAPDVSQGASVSQTIGLNDEVTIVYHRPGVKGRNVWADKSDNPQIGPLVPREGKPRPWRAGANEATTITFTCDVLVEGKPLAAGTYGLFMIPTDKNWTVIFSKNPNQWGAFRYNKDEDALRVDVAPVEAPHQEWLTYGFDDPGPWSTVAFLHWEKVKVPFKIEVANKPETD